MPPKDGSAATSASNEGKLTVCVTPKRCATVTVNPPLVGAFDEVYASHQTLRLGKTRVLVVRQPSRKALTSGLEVWDVTQKRRVRQVATTDAVFHLQRLGEQAALAIRCDTRLQPKCGAHVLDLRTLRMRSLNVLITPDKVTSLIHPAGDGLVIVDVRGTEVVWVDATGKVTHREAIPPLGNADPEIGRIDDNTVAIFEQRPHIGSGHIVALGSKTVTRFDAPRCAP